MPTRNIVFVVDDDPSMLKGIERLLMQYGFESELFDSAEAFQSGARPHEGICLVLDINLKGKSGIELRRQLATSGVSVPVIFITTAIITEKRQLRRAASHTS